MEIEEKKKEWMKRKKIHGLIASLLPTEKKSMTRSSEYSWKVFFTVWKPELFNTSRYTLLSHADKKNVKAYIPGTIKDSLKIQQIWVLLL
jgi:hypothetical protein